MCPQKRVVKAEPRCTTIHIRGKLDCSVFICSLILTTLIEALGVRITGLRKPLSKCFKLLFFLIYFFHCLTIVATSPTPVSMK